MVKILEGERWDIESGQTKVHLGTPIYLASIGATPRPGTEREVPEGHINEQEKYLPPQGANVAGQRGH